MSAKSKNKDIITRSEAARLFHQDGIIDIIAGAVLLNFGFDILNQSVTTSLFTFIPILLVNSMKRQITLQRLEAEGMDLDSAKFRRWTIYMTSGIVLMVIALGTLVLNGPLQTWYESGWIAQYNPRSFAAALIPGIFALAGALLIPLRRLYIYVGFSLFAGIISFFLLPPYFPTFAVAVLMITYGGWTMSKFMRANPIDEHKDQKENKEKDIKKEKK